MNWDNQDNKDPWGNRSNGNDQDFDDLLKRFSSILGSKSGGGKGSSSGGGFNFSPSRFLGYGFFILAVVYLSASIYTVQPGERVVILRLGEYHKETTEGLNFMLFGIDQRFKEDVALTRRYSQTANMLTQDENLVDVTVSVQTKGGSATAGEVGDVITLSSSGDYTLGGSPTGKTLAIDLGSTFNGSKIKVLATISASVVSAKTKTNTKRKF